MSERPARVPTLAEVMEDPALIDQLSAQIATSLLIQISAIQVRIGACLAAAGNAGATPPAEPDEVLDLAGAAARLGMSPASLRNRTTREPWLSLRATNGTRSVRFSALRIAAYLRGEPLTRTRPVISRIGSRRGGP